MLDYPGGEQKVVDGIQSLPRLKQPVPCCCLPRLRLDHGFILLCKRMTLQFVLLKPLTALISLVLMVVSVDESGDPEHSLYHSAAWQYTLLIVYNLSYSSALYFLLVYYMATKTLLGGFHPVGKFGEAEVWDWGWSGPGGNGR